MFAVDSWPKPAARAWLVAQRFQKFLVVGVVGLGVNQALLYVLHSMADVSLRIASPIAIFASMVVTFLLNEHWTWHDRGNGKLVHRMAKYFPINTVGLMINFVVLQVLVEQFGVHFMIANLFGAGLAAIWNFVVNHRVTWAE